MSFISEFKSFAMRGNVVDLAVGVVIGAAFGKIVSSLVSGIVMPLVGLMIGGVNFSHLAITLKEAVTGTDGAVVTPAVTLDYGAFIQTIVDFGIIALAIFVVIKLMNSMQRKEEQAPKAPPEPSAEEKLLAEIRDLLKAQ
ncbi:large-conductance mechanosensitive channel protein MscL [Pseudomarimonas arenosa]|uniref:Large-conductance mechanosensitive channel n=1 Tax=Pseudomarimonas arenosa TaxID=2774145 RepID=A0AAW3ZDG9_9GAMM|nr:large-conductance mechanosensitive channel protein MscL [Pseudomarimonas arenosa]MBD8524236.1 large-conductance mechanosensitive channel protein MscL [Pseudomarimonas arenosa]